MIEKLKEIGADVKYTRVEGEGHGVWERTYDKDLIEWLLSKKRK